MKRIHVILPLANKVVSTQEDVCSNAGTGDSGVSEAFKEVAYLWRICYSVRQVSRNRKSTKTRADDELAGLLKEQKLLMYTSLRGEVWKERF